MKEKRVGGQFAVLPGWGQKFTGLAQQGLVQGQAGVRLAGGRRVRN